MIVKYVILGLLHYKNMHGYRIKEHIERNFGNMWSINYGQIYPALKQMQADGLVTMVEVLQENAPARKLYSITQAGRDEFAKWLASEPENQMVVRDPFLLRFTFMGFGDNAGALKMVDERIAMYEEQLERRKENAARWGRGNVYTRLLSELGLNANLMMLDWLKKAKEEIEAEGRAAADDEAMAVAAAARSMGK